MEPVASRTLVRIAASFASASAAIALVSVARVASADDLEAETPTTEIIGGELTEPGEFDGQIGRRPDLRRHPSAVQQRIGVGPVGDIIG